MKYREAKAGMLITNHMHDFYGEIIDKSTRAKLLVLAYSDGYRHYADPGQFIPLDFVIDRDEDQFHGYVPSLKGLHTSGNTKEECFSNLKDAIQAYVKSMVKHGELLARPTICGRKN